MMRIIRSLIEVFVLMSVGIPIWTKQTLSVVYNGLLRAKKFDNKRGSRVAQAGINHPVVPGVRHEYVEVDADRIHVARAGTDPKKPFILFLHGFPEFWYSWREQLQELQQEYEVAAVDLPGYNASSKSSDRADYVTTNICRILAQVVRSLGRSSCTLVGHDWGGAIAWDFAGLYPEIVERVAVLSAPHPRLFMQNMDLGQASKSTYILAFQQPWVPELVLRADDYRVIAGIMQDPKRGGFRRRSASEGEMEAYKDAIAQPGALTAALNYYRAVILDSLVLGKNKDAARAARQPLKMPVMVLWADEDMALSLNLLKSIGTLGPTVSVHVIPNCSHWIQQDAPDVVNRLLKLFIKDELPVTSRL